MSFDNPTRLCLGMSGNLGGKEYRVVGRSVLGETESGETYYWNEFKLETSSGEPATLVYDETEPVSQWRLFTQFDPEYPMTAVDAASKRVGDRLNLTGQDVCVTFRGASRVYYLEGRAPEGEALGAVAEYFNAGAGDLMQVVSWTGEEVEYYNGANLSHSLVATAFGLPQGPGGLGGKMFTGFRGSGSGTDYSGVRSALKAAAIIALLLVVFGRGFSCSRTYEAAPVKKISAGAPPLAVGATGTLFDHHYRVTAHALVEIAEVGAKWERHEYELTDATGATALLVCGDKPDGGDWLILESFVPLDAPTGRQAAAKNLGDLVALDGYTGKVSELFLSTIEQTDGAELGGIEHGTVSYGFRCTNEFRTLLVRWNDAGIQFWRGRTLPAKKAAAGFTGAK